MCNIWQMDYSNEMDLDEFRKFLADPIFKEVEALGINGGEPTLVKGLDEFAKVILTLPKLKALNIISHGFNKKQLFPFLESTYAACKAAGVTFHVSISLDGYGEVHNTVRGLKVFDIVASSIQEIAKNRSKYCDTYDLGCTVIKQNVSFLQELDAFTRMHNYPIKYRMGIENKRIESDKLVDQFSLLQDPAVQEAREFFHSRISLSRNLVDQFKYYSIFHFLAAPRRERLLGCHWKEDGITMDSRGDLYYCAVASNKIGSLRERSGEEIFFDDANILYRQQIVEHDCNNCIHDYYGKPTQASVWTFFRSMIFERVYWLVYLMKAKFA
jgi:hypothetical protein